jgi:hypothetical protein
VVVQALLILVVVVVVQGRLAVQVWEVQVE